MKLSIVVLAGAIALSAAMTQAAWAQASAPKPGAPPTAHKVITWDALVPKDWDPLKRFREMNVGTMSDSDPRVLELMRELRETWDNAPTNSSMDGSAIKLPGYIVPLDEVKGELKEFLLVPYFGACIHTPPPPANQIVHVVLGKPLKGYRTMDAVWVSGTLKTERQGSAMGTSGYKMEAVALERYVAASRR